MTRSDIRSGGSPVHLEIERPLAVFVGIGIAIVLFNLVINLAREVSGRLRRATRTIHHLVS